MTLGQLTVMYRRLPFRKLAHIMEVRGNPAKKITSSTGGTTVIPKMIFSAMCRMVGPQEFDQCQHRSMATETQPKPANLVDKMAHMHRCTIPVCQRQLVKLGTEQKTVALIHMRTDWK